MKIIHLLLSVLMITITTSCGFKVVKKSELSNYDISSISSIGDKRINYKIKSRLEASSKKNEKKILDIDLNTKKEKTVKEKNIKNEITKYQIKITAFIKFEELNSKEESEFVVTKTGEYSVATQHSQTLNNEKRVIDLLTDKLIDQIIDQIIVKLDAI